VVPNWANPSSSACYDRPINLSLFGDISIAVAGKKLQPPTKHKHAYADDGPISCNLFFIIMTVRQLVASSENRFLGLCLYFFDRYLDLIIAVLIERKGKERKGKEVDLYSAYRQYNSTSKRSDVDHA